MILAGVSAVVSAPTEGGVRGCGRLRLFDWGGKKRRQEEDAQRQRQAAWEKEEAERRWKEKCEAAKVLQQAMIVWGHVYRARDETPPFKVWDTPRELLWRQASNYVLDVKGYIERKANQNVFVCGASGQGKSKLMRRLLALMDGYQRVVFTFKSNDEYLNAGFPIADVAEVMPNPSRTWTHSRPPSP